jgi:hypothetical protein
LALWSDLFSHRHFLRDAPSSPACNTVFITCMTQSSSEMSEIKQAAAHVRTTRHIFNKTRAKLLITQKQLCNHSLTPTSAPMTAPCRSVSFLALAAAFHVPPSLPLPAFPAASIASFAALSVHAFCLSLGENSRIFFPGHLMHLLEVHMFSAGRVISQSSRAHRPSSSKGSRPSFTSQNARSCGLDGVNTKGR